MSDEQAIHDREQRVGLDGRGHGHGPGHPDDAYTELTVDHLFGKIWTRDGLARRDRRLITLTAVAISGQAMPLAGHLAGALRSGDLTPDELQEWVAHLAHYAGWPIAATAYMTLRQVEGQLADA